MITTSKNFWLGVSMAGYWMTIGKIDLHGLVEIKYTRPNLGFSVTRRVPEEMARMLQIAIEVGKELKQDEIKNILGIR